jgi:hypothetical protein
MDVKNGKLTRVTIKCYYIYIFISDLFLLLKKFGTYSKRLMEKIA